MNLFYTPPEQIRGKTLFITGDEARHAVKVLRFRTGDPIMVTDGMRNRYEGVIMAAGKDSIDVTIIKKESIPASPDLILALGLIKNRQRLEYAIEKAVELGCTGIILFKSDHSERWKTNLDRLQSIALSAMKQSLRYHLPGLRLCNSVGEVIDACSNHEIIAAHEKQMDNGAGLFHEKKDYLAFVGPEGGFSDEEIDYMGRKKARIISLGPYRLRSETAVVALLSRFVFHRLK